MLYYDRAEVSETIDINFKKFLKRVYYLPLSVLFRQKV